MNIVDLFNKSIQDLTRNWSVVFLASMPLSFLPIVIKYDQTLGLFLLLILSGPLRVGVSKIAFLATSIESFSIRSFLKGFSCYKNALGVFLLSLVFIMLGLILFIIPGIVLALWMSQSFFILADNPDLEPMEVFKKSKELIKGYEYKYLMVFLFFVLIGLLLFITNLSFLNLLIAPLQYVVFANFYRYLLHKSL